MPPRIRAEAVPRPDIVNRVLGSTGQVTAIIGPAGAGKSTLMAQLHAAEASAVWYSAGDDDDDPVCIWWGLIEAIRDIAPGFGDTYRHRLATAGSAVVGETVVAVANELERRDEPIHLFVDDLHRVSNVATRRSFHKLVTHLPKGDRVTFTSRHSTTIPLARLRVQGNLVEISASDLALGPEETRRLLDGLGVALPPSLIDVLVERTEGWPAGLQLAGMALVGVDDPARFVEDFCGTDRLVADYLVTEVLDGVSAEDATFMIETSALQRLSGELCDMVTGQADSAERLRRLESTNAFITPLDRTGHWFRYHHLFADLLTARLLERDPAEVQVIHGRAFDWLREHGQVSPAIVHGLAAGRRREAAELVCKHWLELVDSGRLRTAKDLVDRFDRDEVADYQPLAIASAFIDGLSGDLRGARRCLDAAQNSAFDGTPPDGAVSMASSLALARGGLALDGLDQALADAETAYELEPPDSPWRPMAALIIGLARTMQGELDEPRSFFEEACLAADDSIRVYALAELALVRLAKNDLRHAEREATEACSLIADNGLEDLIQAATAFGAAASVALARGDDQRAKSLLAQAERPMGYVGQALPMDVMRAAVLLGGVALALGHHETARRHIERAGRIDSAVADTGALSDRLSELRAQLPPRVVGEADGLEDDSVTKRELEVLRLLPTGLTIREIGQELFLSRNTIKTYLSSLYRRLGVSSRSEAVERAVELGFLDETGPSQSSLG
ncbi:MAG: LuxR C-terminal-related transcriptional regulator [Acidimicrobiales bacterium]